MQVEIRLTVKEMSKVVSEGLTEFSIGKDLIITEIHPRGYPIDEYSIVLKTPEAAEEEDP